MSKHEESWQPLSLLYLRNKHGYSVVTATRMYNQVIASIEQEAENQEQHSQRNRLTGAKRSTAPTRPFHWESWEKSGGTKPQMKTIRAFASMFGEDESVFSDPYFVSKQDDVVEKVRHFETHHLPTYPASKPPTIRLGVAPLIDCCLPALIEHVLPEAWKQLQRTHRISVSAEWYSFASFRQAIRFNHLDVAVGTIETVRELRTIRPLAPPLQHFNAYYLFATKEQCEQVFKDETDWASAKAAKAKSLMEKFSKYDHLKTKFYKEFEIYTENSADLEAVISNYIQDNALHGAQGINSKNLTIQGALQDFLRAAATRPICYLGSLLDTAELSKNDNFQLIATPADFGLTNSIASINSMIVPRNTPLQRKHRRFLDFWFDMVNCFRCIMMPVGSSAVQTDTPEAQAAINWLLEAEAAVHHWDGRNWRTDPTRLVASAYNKKSVVEDALKSMLAPSVMEPGSHLFADIESAVQFVQANRHGAPAHLDWTWSKEANANS